MLMSSLCQRLASLLHAPLPEISGKRRECSCAEEADPVETPFYQFVGCRDDAGLICFPYQGKCVIHNVGAVILQTHTFPFSSFIIWSSCSLSQASTSAVSKKYCWAWYMASRTSCLLSVSTQRRLHSCASWSWPALMLSASGLRIDTMIAALSRTSSILLLWPCSSLWSVCREKWKESFNRVSDFALAYKRNKTMNEDSKVKAGEQERSK